jgi:tetratricopeptide (TPR) repeat protein/transcriptional regulator with XRE-family HTH domain
VQSVQSVDRTLPTMSNPTFSQLLTEHMQRAGISDSELARVIGVQRQTIFRWKEGLVSRPRLREDILRIAHKLRLTAEERDQLLLAAGFPPEQLTVGSEKRSLTAGSEVMNGPERVGEPSTILRITDQDGADDALTSDQVATTGAGSTAPHRRKLIIAPVVLAASLLLIVLSGGLWWRAQWSPPMPTPAPVTPTVVVATPVVKSYPVAPPGVNLIVVAQFQGHTTRQFDVAGRIAEEIEKEIAQAGLISTTVATWPDEITRAVDAQAALAASKAALVIWGSYDDGRVRANLTPSQQFDTQHIDFALISPDELVTTINDHVPAEVRMFALLTIGSLFPLDEFYSSAARAYRQALALNPTGKTRALLNFYLAMAVAKAGTLDALDQAIGYYTTALQLNPRLYGILHNRGTLWLRRVDLLPIDSPEVRTSLDAAIADFTATLAVRPNYVDAYLNRGIAYYQRNRSGDQALALADFDALIERRPRAPRGYYNRALAHIRNGDDLGWQADLQMTLALSPTFPAAHYLLCWGYALAEQPTAALPACERAVALDSSGASHDGRAIALAQSGRYVEAATDLRRFLTYLHTLQSEIAFDRQRGPQVRQWIATLERNQNPFDTATLDSLR